MGDSEHVLPSSKKRVAGRELSRDNPGLDDEEDSAEQEIGTFKKAAEDVIANRRIVKVRRNQTSSTPASNPFAGIQLVPTTGPPAEVTFKALTSGEKSAKEDLEDDVTKETQGGQNQRNTSLESAQENDSEKTDETEVVKSVPENFEYEKTEETEKSKDDNERTTSLESVKQDESEKNDETQVTKSVPKNIENEKTEEAEMSKDENSNQLEKKVDKGVTDVTVSESSVMKEKSTTVEGSGQSRDDKIEKEDGNGNGITVQSVESSPWSSFQQLSSSKNAFTGLIGTGFSSSSFSFGLTPQNNSALGSGSLFGLKTDSPTFGFGLTSNGNSSQPDASVASIEAKREGSIFPAMHEVLVETGEENERVAFLAESVLFEYIDGGWKERGKGELKVNVSTTSGLEKGRLLMRAKGNYRLILNANLYPEMKLTNMDKKGLTFACANSVSESNKGLSTFALKFKDASIVENFRAAVSAYIAKATTTVLKTPENSPQATDDPEM